MKDEEITCSVSWSRLGYISEGVFLELRRPALVTLDGETVGEVISAEAGTGGKLRLRIRSKDGVPAELKPRHLHVSMTAEDQDAGAR